MAQVLNILKVTLLLTISITKDVVASSSGSSGSSNSNCYTPYGTFDNSAPFDNPFVFSKAPQCVSVIGTSFKLYNKDKPNGVVLDNTNPVTSDISSGDKIVVLVHGLSTQGGHDESMYSAMRPELLAKKNSNNQEYLNVITVDWTGGVVLNDLQQSFGNARLVAAQIAYFLKKLDTLGKLSCSDVYIIGFSLGASVAGLAGKRLKAQSCQVSRITGLDPVLKGYESIFQALPNGAKLYRTDATYVDVMHVYTSFTGRVGHADFFPNGGTSQPGCGTTNSDVDKACNHFRAVQLFTSTIRSPGDNCEGTKCNDWPKFNNGRCADHEKRKMGFGSKLSDGSNGKYFLTTCANDPYCASTCPGKHRKKSLKKHLFH